MLISCRSGISRPGLIALLALVGCNSGPALPKSYPVTGTIEYADGKPMKGGSLQFTTAGDPLLRVVGEIKADGSFTLRTIKDNAVGAGAPEGEYQVVVQPPALGEPGVQGRSQPAIPLRETYKVEAKENRFKIVLANPQP